MRRFVSTLSRALALFGVIAATQVLSAQSTSVLNLANIDASQAADGLGFNINPGQDWQWAAVAAAGGTHARIQCSWSTVEQQSLPPENRTIGYVEDPNCAKGFDSAARYGIHPTVIAAYGPPFHQIATVTVPGGAPVGARSFNIQLSSGVNGETLSNLAFPYDYFCPLSPVPSGVQGRGQCTGKLASKSSPQGVLISDVKVTDAQHATITLASALITALPADSTPYMVSEILYPSAASQNPNDPSIVAYANYVSFLAQDMANHGVTGDIEIWNEPPWKADSWDFRPGLFDAGLYPGPTMSGANFGFVANLQHRTFPAGITATWDGTSGSGLTSLLGPTMLSSTGQALIQPSKIFTSESFHPYGGNNASPEAQLMVPSCLQAAAESTGSGQNIYSNGRNCYLPGEPQAANLMQALEWDDVAKLVNPSYGIGHSVTETNVAPPQPGMLIPQSRAVVRQFLSYEAVGITPIEFFEMFTGVSGQDPSYSFVDYDGSSFAPRPAYTALSTLMADLRSISQPAVTPYTANTLPSVANFSGTYPLVAMNFVGAREGASANSSAFFVWQLTACSQGENCWFGINIGKGGPVTVNIPSGLSVTAVRNVTTAADVTYNLNGQQISFNVADDPIEILVDPTSASIPNSSKPLLQPTKLTLSANPGTSSFGSQVLISAAVSPSTSKAKTTDGQVVAIFDGGTQIAALPLASGVASFDITSLKVGVHNLRATYAGDANFGGSSGALTFNVTAATPNLTFQPVADQVYGAGSVHVSASSVSPGIISYSVVSGPARVSSGNSSGATVTISGVGTVVVQAKQQAAPGYAALSAQTTFNVTSATPKISFLPVSTQTYGSGPVYLVAGSASHGVISFSIVSGPAKISGNAVTTTGAGTVVVEADQAALGNYSAATGTLSFNVVKKAAQMSLRGIPTQTFGASPVTLSADSSSPAPIVYSIVAGPAAISGNSVVIQGAGNITVLATQAATSGYNAVSARTSFAVKPAVPKLTLGSIGTQVFGAAPIPVQATSLSDGALTYEVTNGPAQMSGSSIALTGQGFIILQVTQAATANYTSASAQLAFRVNPGTPTLKFQAVANQYGLTAPFRVATTSSSSGAITYRVLSGPAKVNQNVVTVTGFGNVVLQATQQASANYVSSTAKTSFMVIPTAADVQ